MSQEKFNKLVEAAHKLKLTNNDLAILLQVTPAMVSRYKLDASGLGKRDDPQKLMRAAKALRWVGNHGITYLRTLTPTERARLCVEAVHEVDDTIESVKTPVLV